MNKLMTNVGFLRATALPAMLVAGVVTVSGCATATIEDAVPQGALETSTAADEPVDPDLAVSSGAAENTGTFPNMSEAQRSELAQMTPAEKNAYLARLAAARSDQTASGGNANRAASAAELKKLARDHNDNVLKQIEGDKAEEEESD